MTKKIYTIRQEYLVFGLICILFIIFFALTYLSEGTYGGSDDYAHYKFARFAFKYPNLFLDHWGKPAFIVLASPFAQFGFLGIKIFNLIVGLLAAYFSYRICKMLNFRFSWLSIIIVCFAPVYMSMLLSGMTEILFSFVLVFSIFLAIRKNFLWSAVVMSFLPFVRNEGIVIFPLFIIYYLLNRRYLAIALLWVGFVFFSIVGAWYYHDIFWVINRMPYTGAKDIYGSGSLFDFVNGTKSIFGIPIAMIGIIGAIALGFKLAKNKYSWASLNDSMPINEVLLVVGPFMAYYAMHSILWWKGWGGSLGLTRVMAGIVPLLAILGVKGVSWATSFLPDKKIFRYPIILVLLYIIIVTPFKVLQIPVELGPAEKVIRDAGLWIHNQGLDKQRVYFYDPFYWFTMDIDPYNQDKVWEVVPDREVPSRDIPANSVIMWDSHYGPNEGKLKLEKLMNDSFLKLQHVTRPLQPFTTLGGYNFEICIFQKTAQSNNIASKWKYYQEVDSLNEVNFIKFISYDFESEQSLYKGFTRSDSIAYSGRFSCLMDKNNEFGPTITFPFNKFKKNLKALKITLRFFAKDSVNWSSVSLVASTSHKGKLYMYTDQTPGKEENGWHLAKLRIEMPNPKSIDDIIGVYVWNRDHQRFYIDDFMIYYK